MQRDETRHSSRDVGFSLGREAIMVVGDEERQPSITTVHYTRISQSHNCLMDYMDRADQRSTLRSLSTHIILRFLHAHIYQPYCRPIEEPSPVEHEEEQDNLQMSTEIGNGDCLAWAARDASGTLSPYTFNRRVLRSDDVSLRIMYCGVCYADIVWTRNKHGDSKYPVVPGHEIVGVITAIGSNVNGFKVGEHVGVGTYVNSCRDCEYCNELQEIHCSKGATYTFNGLDSDGTITKGGYSSYIVVHERYCFKIPDGYPLEMAAPLLCAGITVYNPMMRHKMNQPGKSLGVIGLGGLGHMAVKFGKAFGLKVTIFSTSESKREEALKRLGADKFVLSSDNQQMESMTKSLDFIIDTASGDHPFDPYMSLLKVGGVMVLVGFPGEIRLSPVSLNLDSRSIVGSVTGGTKVTQEMLNFCAANKVYPEIEVIKIEYINEALERLVEKDVKYRFVIDIANSLK
ncbi:putative cinnamyl alcohol dehydrogenase 1 [Canna indica]|uniref:cinnamyl-alcohol dehydrogenase n=1 Tax=Canna indica TaxID=4628 RepID=A0AAQ3Q775_9LILI|nr:putative cinnamyl alcohol dehydrogenase 1 [Canna indica]